SLYLSISLYTSMGLYQCYASVFITLVILYAIFEVVYHDKSVKESFAGCFKALGSFVIAFLLYSVSSRLICKLADVEVNSSRDVLSNLSVNLISKTADILKLTIKRICLPFSIYNRYLLGMIACFLIAGMLVIIAKKVFSEKKSVREIFYILFLFATLPIAVCSIGIISPYIHDLMIYGIWLLFVFCIVVFDKNIGILKESQEKKRHILNCIIPICAFILLWNNVVIANECYMKKDIEDKAALSVMTRVVDDLEDRDDYVLGQTPIMFIGNGPYYYYMEPYANIYEICGVDFRGPIYDTNVWYFNAYQAYFDYVMDYPLVTVDSDYYEKHFEEYTSLDIPAFPADGYIVNVDGVLVVNLDCNNERFR
ncbi:MAG: glucosyltransferase domain-containing protein, partial [Lachnospiraceae bacterium]|nr:glucosyltransferase domain-containing protein [Lachnospiraceae bacterium]